MSSTLLRLCTGMPCFLRRSAEAFELATVPSILCLIVANASMKKLAVEPVFIPTMVPACTYCSAASAAAFLNVSCDIAILLSSDDEMIRILRTEVMTVRRLSVRARSCYCISMTKNYLEKILKARVYDVAIETPLDVMRGLSERVGNHVLLKREDLQPVFSFKLRGAYNKTVHMSPEQRARGVIAASAGNHAQGVALAANRLGIQSLIVMPRTTPDIKVQSVRKLGAKAVLHGDTYDEAYTRAIKLADEKGMVFVHPYDDPEVIAGQGTVAMEILRQHEAPLHAIFVPVGGGGLIAGVSSYVKALYPEVKVIGVEPDDAPNPVSRAAAQEACGAGSGGHLRRRRGRAADRRRAVSRCAQVRGRGDTGQHRRDLRRHQRHLRRHALHRRAGRRAGGRGHEALHRAHADTRRAPRGHRQRRQHELRSPASRRGARRGRRAQRGHPRGDHTGTARQLSRVLRSHRYPQHHRVQLPLRRCGHRACLRGHTAAWRRERA